MQWIPGLVSISFRSLSPEAILESALQAGLSAIEWGGDVHVPFGDLERARQVEKATREAGLSIPSYGSYYRIGVSPSQDFSLAAASARALKTDHIRVWAYNKNPEEVEKAAYDAVVRDARRICREAPDLTICLECHNGTLTRQERAAIQFIQDVGCSNLKMFWQPNQLRSHAENLAACRALLPYIERVHVFSWEGEKHFPLAQHADRWQEYLAILANSPHTAMPLMLEFMHDDRLESLAPTAKTLQGWL